jgi:hypothetical protein
MYQVPETYKRLKRGLRQALNEGDATLLIQVELTLYLAECLGLDAEPLSIGWVLLSRMPLNHPVLGHLSPIECRMLANAALIVPYSSRYAWENALLRYSKIAQEHRLYVILPEKPYAEQMINLARQEPCSDPQRLEAFEAVLSTTLPYKKRKVRITEAGNSYRLRFKTCEGRMEYGSVNISEAMMQHDENHLWFDGRHRGRVLDILIQDLRPIAEFLDEREVELGGNTHWLHDWKQIRYRKAVYHDGKLSLEPENAHSLRLEGAVHLPGMVSAGKTTLAKLLIAYCIRNEIDIRIALVVGDTHSAIEIAHQVNSWFFDNPAGDDVVAVPILGASQREEHLKRLLNSREYAKTLETGRGHWGERWLMPTCPLVSQVIWDAATQVDILAGGEPCTGLIGKSGNDKRDASHICPLSHVCPSKQLYRDMPKARLWVTTPGAFAQAALPKYLDARYGNMGELIYEQSDLVILDEAETIVEWFDKTYAQKEDLTNGKNGLLDSLDVQISPYLTEQRVQFPHHRHWLFTARDSLKPVSNVLSSVREKLIQRWVKRNYFSPNQLAFRLARRLAGLKEWDDKNILPEKRLENERLTKESFEPFNELLNRNSDPLRPKSTNNLQVLELASIMQAINTPSDELSDNDIFQRCLSWIKHNHPDIEKSLAKLKVELQTSENPFDHEYLKKDCDKCAEELAMRLQFTLTVVLLDRHTHIVIEEWHKKPESLKAQEPFKSIPKGMRDILPLPLSGRQYGFVIDKSKSPEASNRLSLFSYTNIGRSYLLNFYRLRTALEDYPAPHVLMLSGTSYLPDSTAFHVPIPPAGVLMASAQTEAALEDSRFIWQSFNDEKNQPIFISGAQNREERIEALMHAMLDYDGINGGFIEKTLRELRELGAKNSAQWEDRGRILMLTNSYKQAERAALVLRERWHHEASKIFNLKQGRDEDFEIEGQIDGTLQRVDIERFALNNVNGEILIAPMQSIGRGFNILNRASKAAFGAIFFLTRPMNPPHDVTAYAQELNRHSLAWADDPSFVAWAEDTLYQRAIKAREKAADLRRSIEHRHSYEQFRDEPILSVYPRRDLAASSAGRIIQAVGRLLRGAVPFRAYFMDAAWSPDLAQTGDIDRIEPAETSLLTAVIEILQEYCHQDLVGKALYSGLSDALTCTENRDNN